jgi:branched-chain amino acid transport system permease protein
VFIGGTGSTRGVILGAVAATTLPELLRLAASWRLVLFGIALLLIINFFPDGLEGGLRRVERAWARRRRISTDPAP